MSFGVEVPEESSPPSLKTVLYGVLGLIAVGIVFSAYVISKFGWYGAIVPAIGVLLLPLILKAAFKLVVGGWVQRALTSVMEHTADSLKDARIHLVSIERIARPEPKLDFDPEGYDPDDYDSLDEMEEDRRADREAAEDDLKEQRRTYAALQWYRGEFSIVPEGRDEPRDIIEVGGGRGGANDGEAGDEGDRESDGLIRTSAVNEFDDDRFDDDEFGDENDDDGAWSPFALAVVPTDRESDWTDADDAPSSPSLEMFGDKVEMHEHEVLVEGRWVAAEDDCTGPARVRLTFGAAPDVAAVRLVYVFKPLPVVVPLPSETAIVDGEVSES